jgi:hypothetical protein
MTEGFTTDQGHGIILVPNWVEGPPRKSAWVGVRVGGKPKSEVSTFRCDRCGFLEHYALQQPSLAQEEQTRSQVKTLLIIVLIISAITVAIALGLLL